jgi:hypothetical protein
MKNMAKMAAIVVLCAAGVVFGRPAQDNNNISLTITDYDQDPSQVLIHTSVPITAGMIMSKGVVPMKISLTNNQDRSVVLSRNSLKITLADPYYLSRQFHILNQFTSSNAFDWMWLSLLINFGWISITSWTGILPFLTLITLGFIPGGLVAAVYCREADNKNKAMTDAFMRDFALLSGKDRLVIYPGQTIQRILLFPKGAVDACTLRIFNEACTESVAGFSIYMTV